MRNARLLLALVAALAVSACMRSQPTYYVVDPATGQPVPVVSQQFTQPQYAQPGYAQPQIVQQQAAPQPYAQQTYTQPSAQPQPRSKSSGRGLFTRGPLAAQPNYAQPAAPQ